MHNNYGVTVLDNGALAIFNCDTCTQTWEEAVDNLKWLNNRYELVEASKGKRITTIDVSDMSIEEADNILKDVTSGL